MQQTYTFATREAFRSWLTENYHLEEGIWLIFGKAGGVKTLSANDALEEALCFGWIDGQMQRIDETKYKKYFKQRNEKSNWSAKNKKLFAALEAVGKMTAHGRKKAEAAQQNGSWDAAPAAEITAAEQEAFAALLAPHHKAYENYNNMTPSARKTYAKSYYFGAKTAAGKEKNLARIIERLSLNLNPMESLAKAKAAAEKK